MQHEIDWKTDIEPSNTKKLLIISGKDIIRKINKAFETRNLERVYKLLKLDPLLSENYFLYFKTACDMYLFELANYLVYEAYLMTDYIKNKHYYFQYIYVERKRIYSYFHHNDIHTLVHHLGMNYIIDNTTNSIYKHVCILACNIGLPMYTYDLKNKHDVITRNYELEARRDSVFICTRLWFIQKRLLQRSNEQNILLDLPCILHNVIKFII